MRLLKLVPDDTNIAFLRWRNVAMAISTLLIALSIGLIAIKGLNFGVDFVGGQVIRTTFAQAPSLDRLRTEVDGFGLGQPSIQEIGAPEKISIRLPLPPGGEEAANKAASKVRAELARLYPNVRIDSVDTVSGKVS